MQHKLTVLPAIDITLRLQQLISNWGGAQRGQPLVHLHQECVDALLRVTPSFPIAIVHTFRAGEARNDALWRIQEYTRCLAVSFAYLLEDDGTLQEFDWSHSSKSVRSTLSAFPGHEVLWNRWAEALQLTDPKHRRVLQYPYHLSGNKRPRYYYE